MNFENTEFNYKKVINEVRKHSLDSKKTICGTVRKNGGVYWSFIKVSSSLM